MKWIQYKEREEGIGNILLWGTYTTHEAVQCYLKVKPKYLKMNSKNSMKITKKVKKICKKRIKYRK